MCITEGRTGAGPAFYSSSFILLVNNQQNVIVLTVRCSTVLHSKNNSKIIAGDKQTFKMRQSPQMLMLACYVSSYSCRKAAGFYVNYKHTGNRNKIIQVVSANLGSRPGQWTSSQPHKGFCTLLHILPITSVSQSLTFFSLQCQKCSFFWNVNRVENQRECDLDYLHGATVALCEPPLVASNQTPVAAWRRLHRFCSNLKRLARLPSLLKQTF